MGLISWCRAKLRTDSRESSIAHWKSECAKAGIDYKPKEKPQNTRARIRKAQGLRSALSYTPKVSIWTRLKSLVRKR